MDPKTLSTRRLRHHPMFPTSIVYTLDQEGHMAGGARSPGDGARKPSRQAVTKRRHVGTATPAWKLALAGASGAIAPDALLLYSKRFTQPHLSFDWRLY